MTGLSAERRKEIRDEVAAMRNAILTGTEVPKPVRRPAVRKSRVGVPSPREPKYNYRQMADLRRKGLLVREIAAETGAHPETVRTALRTHGLDPHDPRGAPRREKCGKGLHDMDEHGRRVKGGGRYCVPCKKAKGAK